MVKNGLNREMRDLLPPNPRVFDIGANRGEKTERYLSFSASQVVSVEPSPDCVHFLRDKFKGNSNVVIVPMCVADFTGFLPFFPADQHSDLSTADAEWRAADCFKKYKWGDSITVPATTLDELVRYFGVPDFCKIDVEGYELKVLKGMTKPIPYLSFEFASEFLDRKTKPCLELLSSFGYRFFNVAMGETEEFGAFEEWVDVETLFSYLKNYPDAVFWGDIYACFSFEKNQKMTNVLSKNESLK